jgi:uncharacterized protein with von Willebrand factor type A (vWA) domain
VTRESPVPNAGRPALLDNVVVFGRLLRRLGIDADAGRLIDAAAALPAIDIGSRDEVHHALRTLLVQRHEQFATFDLAFAAFWRDPHDYARVTRGAGSPPSIPPATRDIGAAADQAVDSSADARESGAWSEIGGIADKDFARFTDDEIVRARTMLAQLVWTPGRRRTRRWIAGRGPRIDLRRALAHSRRTGGDVVLLPRRARRIRTRGLVLICDVSGSMERYSRMLLHFAHAMGTRHRRFEAFLFSTGLTRITRQLRASRIDQAVTEVSRAVPDWSGGTRTGEALRQFHQRWARRVLTGGPIVLLVSDGWDRGDPQLLRDEIARLQRSCHRLIWLNPLIGTANYAPLTRGLQAALPFVDDFLAVRTMANLVDLAAHLNALAAPRLSREARPANERQTRQSPNAGRFSPADTHGSR